jgi:hypothetical protein
VTTRHVIYNFAAFFLLAGTFAATSEADPFVIGPRPPTLGEIGHWTSALKGTDHAKALSAAKEVAASGWSGGCALLLDFYRTGEPENRLAAVQSLAALGGSDSADALVAIALNDRSPRVRQAASDGVKLVVGANPALQRFQAAADDAQHATPLMRGRAIHSAARVNPDRAAGLLCSLLANDDPTLACAAAEELAYVPSWPSVDGLMQHLDPQSEARAEVRQACGAALERLTGKTFAFDLTQWSAWRTEVRSRGEDRSPEPFTYVPVTKHVPVDVVVAFDTTGSFLHAWADLSHPLEGVLRAIRKLEPDARFGLIRYRAVSPEMTLKYTLWPTPLTYDLEQIQREMDRAAFGGGSGALHEALRFALSEMAWREHARRILVVIGDDEPQSPVEDAFAAALKTAQEASQFDTLQINTIFTFTSASLQHGFPSDISPYMHGGSPPNPLRAVYERLALAGNGRFYEFHRGFKNLIDRNAEKIDLRVGEQPEETARKWLTPVRK